ncbi:hypothetical protein DFH06DRAFT_1463592 [Mycena polygramma]|nr:hypothetical protein DFH06DRAFT_1463592 [Mycena polygramma]
MALPITNLTVGWSLGLNNVENQVKALIQAAEANIERLTAQIRELDCIREKERSVLATLRLMVVPIGKLPTELLAEIFKIAVQTTVLEPWPRWHPESPYIHDSLYWPGEDTSAGLRKVLRLAQVSPYWRQIVHNTPQLWAEGVVDVKWGRPLTDTYLSGLKTLVTRSTPYSISVSLTRGPRKNRSFSDMERTLKRVADIMVPTAQRWRNLHLEMDCLDQFDDPPPRSFEVLEQLQIQGLSEQTDAVTLFQSSHRLRHFTLKTNTSKIHLIQLPWQQLTCLSVEDNSLGAVRQAFLQCHNLVSAKFTTSTGWDLSLEAAVSPLVVLPFLATLNMTLNGLESPSIAGLEAFFAPLSLPSLTSIYLHCDYDASEQGGNWPMDVFSEFQRRAPKIEKIELQSCSIESDGLAALLQHGPSLTALTAEFAMQCNANAFFNALRYDTSDLTPLAPNLQDIHLWCIHDFEEDTVEEAIRTRWWKDGEGVLPDGSPRRVCRLKSVTASHDDSGRMSAGFTTRTEDLVEQGLELLVSISEW